MAADMSANLYKINVSELSLLIIGKVEITLEFRLNHED